MHLVITNLSTQLCFTAPTVSPSSLLDLIASNVPPFAAAPFSASAAMSDPAAVGRCVVSQCTGKLARCLTSPKCAANLVCINSCTGRKDESECQIRCGDLFENEVVGDFNACAVSQKKCVPQRQDDGAYPEPSPEAIVKRFDTRVFDGRWYISAGLNDAFALPSRSTYSNAV